LECQQNTFDHNSGLVMPQSSATKISVIKNLYYLAVSGNILIVYETFYL